MSNINFILSSTEDDLTCFVTLEYLNKIILSEKGFSNFPEKSRNFSWKEDSENDNSFQASPYNQFLDFLLQMIGSKLLAKNFLANSLFNLISQTIRILWNEYGEISAKLETIFEILLKNVFF